LNVTVSILGLAFLVLIHEAGHFVVALAVRMRPRRFYIGFPPAVVKRVRNGVEYGIGAVPLGGYVKIPGMHRPAAGDVESNLARALDEAPWLGRELEPVKRPLGEGQLDEARRALPELRAALARADLSAPARRAAERGITDLDDALAPDAYWRATAWKRIAVIFAGPATNLVFAVGLLALVFMLGVPVDTTRRVDTVMADSPAERAGLQPGDEIVAINGAATEPERISSTIRQSRGAELTVAVERDGRRVELRPTRATRIEGNYRLGFVLAPRYESFGPARSFRLAAEETWLVTKAIGSSLGRIVTGSGREDLATPVGIVQGSSQALEQDGFRIYLRILAFISLSLALLNLLPLLPLDGGHIAFSVIEKLRGRALPREAYERVSVFGIALVLLLFVLGLSNDIDRLNGG
jgi:regulator of sigma E protease